MIRAFSYFRDSLHSGMRFLICLRNQLHVYVRLCVVLPMTGKFRVSHHSEKENCDSGCDGPGLQDASAPAFAEISGLPRRQRELKSILCGADGDTAHAGGTFR